MFSKWQEKSSNFEDVDKMETKHCLWINLFEHLSNCTSWDKTAIKVYKYQIEIDNIHDHITGGVLELDIRAHQAGNRI